MAKLELKNGDVFTGKTAHDVVIALTGSSPFTVGDDAKKYMLNQLPMLRGAIPNRHFRIPDAVADDPEAFLRLYEAAGLGKYTPTDGGPSRPAPKLGAFGAALGVGPAPSSRAVLREPPANAAEWPLLGQGRGVTLSDGREYFLLNTVTGWVASISWDGQATYLDAHGFARTPDRAKATRFTSADEAARAVRRHFTTRQ